MKICSDMKYLVADIFSGIGGLWTEALSLDCLELCIGTRTENLSLLDIENRYFFGSVCRPTIGDAARVLKCDVDTVVNALRSACCIDSVEELTVEEISGRFLDAKSVQFLAKYNYNKLKKYYLASVKDVESMSEEERRTFDKFVKSYSFSSKNRRVQRTNRRKIEREFLRELFTPLTASVIYDLTQTEAETIGGVRKSSTYKSLFINMAARCRIKAVPHTRRRGAGLLAMLISLRYHIFSSESEDNNHCAFSISNGSYC